MYECALANQLAANIQSANMSDIKKRKRSKSESDSDSERENEQVKKKRSESKREDEEAKADKKLKSFRLEDFLEDKLDDFDEIMDRCLKIASYNVEMARFVYIFKNMGKKLAKAVSTHN